jgi:hypothetical protein
MKKLILIPLMMLFGLTLQAQQQSQVQSAYIYHFTKYMEWPSNKQSGDFVIGVVGSSPILPYLQSLAASKKAGMQKIVVKKFSSVSAATSCHMLFISSKNSSELSAAIAKGKKFNALIVTEKSGLGKKGACINFVIIGGKARFEINESAIKSNNIKVSAKLMQMGIKV